MTSAIDGLLDAAVTEDMKRLEAQSLAVNYTVGMISLSSEKGGHGHPSLTREKGFSLGSSFKQALLKLEERIVKSAYTAAIVKASARLSDVETLAVASRLPSNMTS